MKIMGVLTLAFLLAAGVIEEAFAPSVSFKTETAPPLNNVTGQRVPQAFHSLDGYFTENEGQLSNRDVLFHTTSGDTQMGFEEGAVLIRIVEHNPSSEVKPLADAGLMQLLLPEPGQSRGVLLRLEFEGANKVPPQGRGQLPFPTNFFMGSDPGRWRTNVRSYREIAYEGLYNGVDLVYSTTDKGVKYDFIIAPGADVSAIRMSYEGADGIELDAEGNMLVRTAVGVFGDSHPIAYQGNDELRCSFISLATLSYGFACNGVDGHREIVIDPLIYSTYLGGGSWDYGHSIAIDTAGNAYLTGITRSADFPATAGAFDITYNGSNDVFVAKLDSTGSSLLYSTYLGGGGDERGYSIAIDSARNAYLTGHTNSSDFPVTAGAFDATYNGLEESFVAKLDPTGSSLLYSTYLGGSNWEYGYSIVVDSVGIAYTIGHTASPDFPVTPGAFDTTHNGFGDAFVTKLDPTGSSLLYSTYLGGGYWDEGNSIAIDSTGNAYLTGYTASSNFPVTPGAFDETFSLDDAFVAKLDPTGSSLIYSTYLGGDDWEYGYSIAVDSAGNAYTTGETWSMDFPVTPGAFDTTPGWMFDAYLTKLDSTGSSLLYSTYIAGDGDDWGESVAVDPAGNAYVTGHTESADFPVTPGAFDATLNGSWDSFVAKLNSTGSSLIYSTYLGGGNNDSGISLTIDPTGDAFVTGYTNSSDFPVSPVAFDTTFEGYRDAFVTKISTLVSPPVADLSVSPSDMALSPLPPYAEGTTVQLNTTVHNLGGNYTESTAARFHDGAPPAPRIGTDQPLAPIPGGGMANVSVFWNASPAGLHDICIVADPYNVVAETDETNNIACVEAEVLFTLNLTPGHRFMSFPMEVIDDGIESILSSIAGCYDYVRWYDPLDMTSHWKSYVPGKTSNSLLRLDNTMGFWTNITSTCNFAPAGTRPSSTTINFHQGWNMVGFPSFNTSYTAADLKADLGLTGVIVEAFDPNAAPYYLQRVNDGYAMRAGEGYWIYVSSDTTWVVNG